MIESFSPGLQIFLQVVLTVFALFCGWIVFDTRRSMNWMARLGPAWMPFRETSISWANKPVVIWLYRIDAAIVFAGIAFVLVSHWLAR